MATKFVSVGNLSRFLAKVKEWAQALFPTKDELAAAKTEVVTEVEGKGYQTAEQVDAAVTAKGYQTAEQVTAAVTEGTKGLVSEDALTGKGYQTAEQVDAAVTAKGYQTAEQVTAAVTEGTKGLVSEDALTGKGYQTADEVEAAITAKGYETSAGVDTKVDAAKQELQTAIDTAVGTTYKAKGSCALADLPALADAKIGDVWNINEAFTTTADFVEGEGKEYPAGSNVVRVNEGGKAKWDMLAGTVEISFATDADVDALFA